MSTIVISRESQYLVGFVLRRDLLLAVGENCSHIERISVFGQVCSEEGFTSSCR